VCPTGIDIRDGSQLECIQCALCIDACNDIMDRIGRPRGLIGYDTMAKRLSALAGVVHEPMRLIRPRTVLYAAALAVVGLVMLIAWANRTVLELNVLADRNPAFVALSGGGIRNGYTVKILNKERAERIFRLEFKGVAGAKMRIVGLVETANWVELRADPDTVTSYQIYISADRANLRAERADVRFVLTDITNLDTATRHTWFYGPKP
jgi:polyferredoxin